MWLLTIEDDEGLTTYHRLSGERCSLGRTPDNDVVLAQLNISRRHARLERRGGVLLVRDEGSRAGSFLNGQRVLKPTPVADGDALQLGDYVVRFSRELSALDLTPPPRYVVPARLRGLAGPVAGFEHMFVRDEIVTIGRWDDCTLRIVHEDIGPLFAVVRPLPDGRHELLDEGGGGRLFVNGRQVFIAQVLEGGDAINLAGVALLRYLEPSQMPDPRFDQFWGEGVAPPPAEPLPVSLTPAAIRRGRGVALGASGAGAGEGGGAGGRAGRAAATGQGGAGAPGVAAGEGGGAARPAGQGGGAGEPGGGPRREFGELDLSDHLEELVDALLPPRRVESAGPLALPVAMPPSASYRRLRQTTIGRRADSKGRERAVVVERVATPDDDDEAPKPRRSFPSLHSPLLGPEPLPGEAGGVAPEGEVIRAGAGLLHTAPTPVRIERDPSGRLLTAFEASVDDAYRDAEGAGLLPGPGEPGAEVPEAPGRPPLPSSSSRRPRAAALYALAVGGFGVVFGLRLLGPAAGGAAPSGAQLRSVATPLVATSEGPSPAPRALLEPEAAPRDRAAPPPPEGPPASSGAQAGPQEAPAAPAQDPALAEALKRRPRVASAAGAEAQDPSAGGPKPPAGARRSRLEARARAGRASADELRELMSVCQAAADASCIALVVPLLRRVGDEP